MKKIFNLFCVVFVSLFCFTSLVKAEDITSIMTFEELKALESVGGSAKLDADITMTNDIRFSEDLVLDLNGHILSTNTGMTLIILSDVTFKDTGSNGKITNGNLEGDFTIGTDWQSIQIGGASAEGSLTIESGSYEAKYIIHGANGKLVINGGTFNATSQYIIGNSSDGDFEVEINDGEFNYSGIYQAINSNSSKITMNGGTIKSTAGSGIVGFKDSEVIINDGTIDAYDFAVSGNGSASGTNEGTNAKFTINGGTLMASNGPAIYAPQINGVTTITGGNIEGGESGIEIRAGKLTISGGSITGNTEHNGVTPNGSGTTTDGAAVAIAQHTTKQPIEVVITGGTFNGYLGLKESNPQGNSAEDLAKISVSITGGTFNARSEDTVYSEDLTGFITGGKYTTSVEDYLKEGYAEILTNGMYEVYEERSITLNEVNNGEVTLSKTSAVYNDTITMTIKPNENYVLESVKVLKSDDSEVEVNDNSFTMPDDDVTVTVRFIKVITNDVIVEDIVEPVISISNQTEVQALFVEALQQDEDLLAETTRDYIELVLSETELTDAQKEELLNKAGLEDVELLGSYDISVVVKDIQGNELGKIEELSSEIELTLNLPEALEKAEAGYTRTYYLVREHDGEYELIDATVTEDGKSLTFKTDKFSTYTVAYNDALQSAEQPASNPTTNDNIVMFAIISVSALLVSLFAIQKIKVSAKK